MGGAPSGKKIEKHDLVMIDIFPKFRGYWSDTTRTIPVTDFTQKQRDIHKIVVKALSAGIEAIRPGIRASDLDRAVRDVITGEGYGDNFGHHAGHGIGLTHFEEPMIVPYNEIELKEGMVLTVEPGIYVPGRGGVRIEEVVLITKDGKEVLSR